MMIDVCALTGTSNLNQMPNQCENVENAVEFGRIIEQALGQGLSKNANVKTANTAPVQLSPAKDAEIDTEMVDVNAETLVFAQFTPKLNFVENVDLSVDTREVNVDVTAVESVQAVVDNTIAPQMPIDAANNFNPKVQFDPAVAPQGAVVDNAQPQPDKMINAEQPQFEAEKPLAELNVQMPIKSTTFNNEVAEQVTMQKSGEKQTFADNARQLPQQDFATQAIVTEPVETVKIGKVPTEPKLQMNVTNAVENVAVAVENVSAKPIENVAVAVEKQPIDVVTNHAVVAEQVAPLVKADAKIPTTQIENPQVNVNSTQVAPIDTGVTATQSVKLDVKQQNSDTFEQKDGFKRDIFAKNDSFTNEQAFQTTPQQTKTMSDTQGIDQSRNVADESITKVKFETDVTQSATVNVATTQKTATLTQVEATSDAETIESVKTQVLTEIYDKYQNGINEFEIRLKPNELGEVTVKMAVKGSELVIELVAQDAKTEQIILSSSNEIKEILQSQLNQPVVIDFVDNDNAQFNYNDGGQNNEQQQPEQEQKQNQTEQNNLTDDFVSLMMKMQSASY